MTRKRVFCSVFSVVMLSAGRPATAQMASASTAALGMGDNFTAAARGLNAVAWNPAALGLHGGEIPSLTLLTIRGSSGIAPITVSDLARFAGDALPADTKTEWLARIEARGRQTGSGSLEATWGAFHVGRFGAQFSSSSRVVGDLTPNIARLVMLGSLDDVDRTVVGLDRSSFRLQAWSTAGVSYAHPFDLGRSRVAVGLTTKYSWGHLFANGEHAFATADPSSLTVVFPVVQTLLDGDSLNLDSGRGFGIDVAAAWQNGTWTITAVVQNVVSHFQWQLGELRYRPLSLSVREGGVETETGLQPLSSAPAAVQQMIADLDFKPVYAAAIAANASRKMLVTADARFSEAGGMLAHPTRHVGAGMQYRVLPWLPVRVGAATIARAPDDTGYQLGSGFGLDLGGWNLSASGSHRSTGRLGTETTVMISVFATGLR